MHIHIYLLLQNLKRSSMFSCCRSQIDDDHGERMSTVEEVSLSGPGMMFMEVDGGWS